MAHPMTGLNGAHQARRRPLVRRLMLKDFRSYASLDLSLGGRLVVLCGENGAGKTNLLEALSLFSPGRGLRRAELDKCARSAAPAALRCPSKSRRTARPTNSARRSSVGQTGTRGRRNRIDRMSVASSRAFCDHVRLVWLTPTMDSLFTGPADRRRRVPRSLRAGDRSQSRGAGRAVRAGAARAQPAPGRGRAQRVLARRDRARGGRTRRRGRRGAPRMRARLKAMIAGDRDDASPFPWAELALEGDVETLVARRRRLRRRIATARFCATIAAATPPPDAR